MDALSKYLTFYCKNETLIIFTPFLLKTFLYLSLHNKQRKYCCVNVFMYRHSKSLLWYPMRYCSVTGNISPSKRIPLSFPLCVSRTITAKKHRYRPSGSGKIHYFLERTSTRSPFKIPDTQKIILPSRTARMLHVFWAEKRFSLNCRKPRRAAVRKSSTVAARLRKMIHFLKWGIGIQEIHSVLSSLRK